MNRPSLARRLSNCAYVESSSELCNAKVFEILMLNYYIRYKLSKKGKSIISLLADEAFIGEELHDWNLRAEYFGKVEALFNG